MIRIRNSVKALIIKEEKLLCTKNEDQYGVFYLLPGGRQEPLETVIEALKRECIEEVSADVDVQDIVFIREYIGKNHEFVDWDSGIHQIDYLFECTLKPGSEVKNGKKPDSMQIGIEWLDLDKIEQYRIYPKVLKELIEEKGIIKHKVYLGDIN